MNPPSTAPVLTLDVGTSSARVRAYDPQGFPFYGWSAQTSYVPTFTSDGGATLDAGALFRTVVDGIDRVAGLAAGHGSRFAALGTTTFWHSLVGLDSNGNASTPVHLWMDARSGEDADWLRSQVDEEAVRSRTGCPLHWNYWPAKLRWFRRTQPDLFERVHRWCSFGEFFTGQLTGDARIGLSMASATGLLDTKLRAWDRELLDAVGVVEERLPILAPDGETPLFLRPEFATRWPGLAHVPMYRPIGDGAASNLGVGAVGGDRLALMVGTSAAIRAVLPADEAHGAAKGLFSYRLDAQRHVIGGALNDGGSLFAWMQRLIGFEANDRLEAELAAQEPDGHGLTLLPFWSGERSTGWSTNAQGVAVGFGLHTRPIDLVRAGLEAIALRMALLHRLLSVDVAATELLATGNGLLSSPAWMQIMADAIGRPVVASLEPEASSRGAALWALERLGRLPVPMRELAVPRGAKFSPRPEATRRYEEALERQEKLYATMIQDRRPVL